MGSIEKFLRGASGHLHWLGMALAALFWVLDAAVDVWVFRSGSFIECLLTPGPVELWMRVVVVILLVGLGFFAQGAISRIERAERALRQAQKMEAVGRLAGGIAHDFNNLLTVILAEADMIAADLPPESAQLRARVQGVREASQRGAALIRQLLAFSRPGKLSLKPVDLGQLVAGLATTLRRLLPATIDVQVITEDCVPIVHADPATMEQIVLNLATNARDAMPGGGQLRVDVGCVDREESPGAGQEDETGPDYVRLSVSDSGVGMDDSTRQKIFEPFFTTKPPGAGTGLGLSVIYGLVTEHEGFIDVRSEVGEGTTFDVYLPISEDGAAAAALEREEVAAVGGSETILLVDDDDSLSQAMKRVLERYGYSVLLAADGREALRTFRTRQGEIDLVVSDMVMPNMSGPDLYAAIWEEAPDTKFMFVSGYAPDYLEAKMDLHPTIPFLAKPWAVADLLAKLRDVLDREAVG